MPMECCFLMIRWSPANIRAFCYQYSDSKNHNSLNGQTVLSKNVALEKESESKTAGSLSGLVVFFSEKLTMRNGENFHFTLWRNISFEDMLALSLIADIMNLCVYILLYKDYFCLYVK